MTRKQYFSQLSFYLLIPTLFIWLTGFLSQGAHIAFFITLLGTFHSFPKMLQLVIELVFPLLSFIFALKAEKNKKRIVLLVVSGLLVVLAVAGSLMGPKTTAVHYSQNLTPSPTIANMFCLPNELKSDIAFDAAAGNIYATLTIKNIANRKCQIQANQFITPEYTAKNIVTAQQGAKGRPSIILSPSQIVYSQIHYPNGPQCSSGILSTPVTFGYAISPTDTITFIDSNNAKTFSVTTCISDTEKTQIDLWSISLQPLH